MTKEVLRRDDAPMLAVLRASAEGKDLGHYFGSWLALDHWIEETRRLGWIERSGAPTELGREVYLIMDLALQPDGRYHFWRFDDRSVFAEPAAAEESNR